MSRRILIADDSQDTLQMLEVFLGLSGWEVSCANTPAKAMARIDAEVFDVVILDRWFADEDGLELCRTLRSRFPGLPIVILSGAAHPGDLERATEAGCNAYLVKPCDVDELARVVDRLVTEAHKEERPL